MGYILTMTRNNDGAVLNKDNAINDAKTKISSIDWYVPHYTPSIAEQTIIFKKVQSKTPTKLQYPERSFFIKAVNAQSLRNFELGTQEGINVPILIFVGFQQMDRQDSQNLNNDTFHRPPVTSAHVVIGTEGHRDNNLLLNYDNDDCSQAYGQIREAFKALTQDDIFQPYISENDSRLSNDVGILGYALYAFDIRYQKSFESTQPIKGEFKFDGVNPANVYGYDLFLTNRLVSIDSDGQRVFELV